MILIAIVDEQNGMAFNGRRQSRDGGLMEEISRRVGSATIRMDNYSAQLWNDRFSKVSVDEDCLANCLEGEYCLVERTAPSSAQLERVETLVLYRWHRVYPADIRWNVDPLSTGFELTSKREFSGSSHETISEEVYVRCD